MERELIIGEVLKPQGIRGELKIKPFTDSAEVFTNFKRVFMDGEEYKVLGMRIGGDGCVYLALRGVPDRNAAELLRGKHLTVPRDDAPPLEEGTYYIADLLGSEVYTESGKFLGILKDVRQLATDVYTVEKDGKEVLFPAVAGVVESVDLIAKKITVNAQRFEEVAVL